MESFEVQTRRILLHAAFIEVPVEIPDARPWSATSQVRAPVNVLLDFLAGGWCASPWVGVERFWYGGGRRIEVFYFELRKSPHMVVVPVQSNPVVRRLLRQQPFQFVPLNCEHDGLWDWCFTD